ncbi:MAG: tetratricopeptide repeat protein [Kofleriaceae bacterium]|nr:tetratricopeptide repeat protein [Kofleriaceae bacterium]
MDLNELKSLAKKLPQHQPDAERSAILRKSLLSAAQKEIPHKSPRNLWFPIAAVAAAALAFYAGSRLSTSNPMSAPSQGQQLTFATLGSEDGATFSRELNPVTGVEEVSLSKGGLHVNSQNGQEILVRVRDAEIHGTAAVFDVRASDNQLHSVRVQSGRVELHIKNQLPVTLAPGQEWSNAQIVERIELALRSKPTIADGTAIEPLEAEPESEDQATDEPHVEDKKPQFLPPTKPKLPASVAIAKKPTQLTSSKPKPVVVTDSVAAAPGPDTIPSEDHAEEGQQVTVAAPAEQAFAKGFRALKRRDYTKAITALSSAIELGNDNAMRGDSRYWLSIALAKSGKNSQAMQAMSGFLRHHGDSSRAGEVSTMLGWLYVEKSQLERAAGLFKRGLTSASTKVRQSANAGLQAIERSH